MSDEQNFRDPRPELAYMYHRQQNSEWSNGRIDSDEVEHVGTCGVL